MLHLDINFGIGKAMMCISPAATFDRCCDIHDVCVHHFQGKSTKDRLCTMFWYVAHTSSTVSLQQLVAQLLAEAAACLFDCDFMPNQAT